MEADQIFDGRYKLIKRIGTGGFSEVWHVGDQMALDASFALKIYKPKGDLDKTAIQQFRQEFLRLVNLAHPNVIRVYSYSIHEGLPYLVLPYYHIGNLSKQIEQRHLFTEEYIRDLFLQISEGLAYLHAQHIVHKDIKPDNILISGNGQFIITDLGISDSLRQTISYNNDYKHDAVSLPYAAPEVLQNKGYYDQKSDIFSLGVLMYECLTNKLPWEGMGGAGTSNGGSKLEVPKQFEAFSEIVNSCVASDPKKRPTAQELITSLRAKKPKRPVNLNYIMVAASVLFILISLLVLYFSIGNNKVMCSIGDTRQPVISENKIWFREGFKYGFADEDCVVLIPATFEDAMPFSDGLAPVKQDGKWGYIDHSGKWMIQPQYTVASPFDKGKAKVVIGRSSFSILKDGQKIE